MNALLDPVNRARGGIKWGLVAHTAATFTFATIYIALNLNVQSLSFIDNREFPGTGADDAIPPGPVGYQWSIRSKPIGIAPTPMLVLNNWLTDGLLVSVSRLTLQARYLALTTPPALSLLYCLCYGLLGHRHSMHNVPCLFGYVLEPTRNQVRYQANLTATATGTHLHLPDHATRQCHCNS